LRAIIRACALTAFTRFEVPELPHDQVRVSKPTHRSGDD
jgi:hypothetical protein